MTEQKPAAEQDQAAAAETTASAQPVEDFLALANSAFEGSTTYLDTNYRTQWERNIRQHRSQHPRGSKYLSETWKHKSRFFRPKTRAATRKAEAGAAAAYFSTADVIDIEAYDDDDDVQKASAALWKEATNYRLKKSVPWFITVLGAYQDAQVMGAVVSHQTWDHELDRPKADVRPLENIRIDPAANWTDPINTSPYLIDMLPMYVYEVKERIARTDDTKWHAVSDGELLAAANANFDSTRLTREGNRTDPKEGAKTGITDFDIVWVHRVIMRRRGADVIYYTLSKSKLLSEPVPLSGPYPWLSKGMRPYTMGICVIETHRTYPAGPVELGGPVQQELNEVVNQRRDNVRLVLDKRYLVKRFAQVDIRSLTRNIAGSVTMANDPKNDIEKLEWTDVTGSAYQEEDRLNLDHDDLTGTFSGSSVQSNRKLNETVGGMNHLATDAALTGDYTLKTFTETWYEPTLNQILLLEQFYETDEVVLAFAGKKAGLVQRFGISVITDDLLRQQLTLTVNVGMGATDPIKSIERFMLGINSLARAFGPEKVAQSLDFMEVSEELFGKLGYKDGKRFQVNQDDPRIADLLNQISDLQTKLLQKRNPDIDAAQAGKLRAETMKIIVEAFFGATQGAELISSIPEIAAVADKILEASGYTPPVPAGQDPNIPTPAGGAVGAPTGATATGAAAAGSGGAPVPPPARRNTSPQQPAVPASATSGFNNGIEGGHGQ